MILDTPTYSAIYTENGRDDRAGGLTLIPSPDGSLDVFVDAPKSPITDIVLRWQAPLTPGTRILGDHWERGYGDLEWRGVAAERPLPWYVLLHEPAQNQSHGFGVKTGAACFASWRVDETGVSLVLDLRNGGFGVRLGDRRLLAATLRELSSSSGEPLPAFARRFCQTLCPRPRLPKQPIYGGNDWYSRYGGITAETVKQDSELIRDLSPSTTNPPSYVIDAGWYPTDEQDGGTYDRGNYGFPDMPGLAERLSKNGVKPGIWIRPLMTTQDAPQSWRFSPKHPLTQTPGVFLDPSVPEVLERVSADIARLSAWGYTLIKQDFTTWDITGRWGFEMTSGITQSGWAFSDRTRTTAEIITTLYAAIRDAAGDAEIIGCNTVGHLSAGLFALQRTGDDTSGRHWERTRKMGINALAFRMPQHGTFFVADADCVGLRPDISWEQNRQWLDVLAKSGTALFVSADPSAVGPKQKAALRDAFVRAALPMPPSEPLDWLDTTCPRVWRSGTEAAEGEKTYDWAAFPGAAFPCPA